MENPNLLHNQVSQLFKIFLGILSNQLDLIDTLPREKIQRVESVCGDDDEEEDEDEDEDEDDDNSG
jgi:hypothetical protein